MVDGGFVVPWELCVYVVGVCYLGGPLSGLVGLAVAGDGRGQSYVAWRAPCCCVLALSVCILAVQDNDYAPCIATAASALAICGPVWAHKRTTHWAHGVRQRQRLHKTSTRRCTRLCNALVIMHGLGNPHASPTASSRRRRGEGHVAVACTPPAVVCFCHACGTLEHWAWQQGPRQGQGSSGEVPRRGLGRSLVECRRGSGHVPCGRLLLAGFGNKNSSGKVRTGGVATVQAWHGGSGQAVLSGRSALQR